MRSPLQVLAAVVVVAGAISASALAATSSGLAPASLTSPTVNGTARAGSMLFAWHGDWSSGGQPSYTYQWQRCYTDGTGCVDLVGATRSKYLVSPLDVQYTLRVQVTAANANGKFAAASSHTPVIASRFGPTNTSQPKMTGTAHAGDTLAVTTGSWAPTVRSYDYKWQQCTQIAIACSNIVGATGRTYGVTADDAGSRFRVLVTAHSAGGQATAASTLSAVVPATGS